MHTFLLVSFFAIQNFCLLCHSDVRVLYNGSIHSKEGIECVGCHGGNPFSDDISDAHRKNFKGKIKREEIPSLCSTCHSDTQKMKLYNLPSDQYHLYLNSPHGKLLQKGNKDVAVCTDCHSTHDILSSDNPKSPAYIKNVPQTCT